MKIGCKILVGKSEEINFGRPALGIFILKGINGGEWSDVRKYT